MGRGGTEADGGFRGGCGVSALRRRRPRGLGRGRGLGFAAHPAFTRMAKEALTQRRPAVRCAPPLPSPQMPFGRTAWWEAIKERYLRGQARGPPSADPPPPSSPELFFFPAQRFLVFAPAHPSTRPPTLNRCSGLGWISSGRNPSGTSWVPGWSTRVRTHTFFHPPLRLPLSFLSLPCLPTHPTYPPPTQRSVRDAPVPQRGEKARVGPGGRAPEGPHWGFPVGRVQEKQGEIPGKRGRKARKGGECCPTVRLSTPGGLCVRGYPSAGAVPDQLHRGAAGGQLLVALRLGRKARVLHH